MSKVFDILKIFLFTVYTFYVYVDHTYMASNYIIVAWIWLHCIPHIRMSKCLWQQAEIKLEFRLL